jgi:pimeloyl-ACP methyl ester carboxylesterase
MKTTKFLTLPDDRQLAYAEYGNPDGHPVLYFHGHPSSRLEPLILGNEVIARCGLRVIAPDRPGMGQSDFQPNRGFSDWVSDVVCLANALNLDKFSVAGTSGGCGYVAACAAKIPERLHAAVIIAGGWRMDLIEDRPALARVVSVIAKYLPRLYQVIMYRLGQSVKQNQEKLLATLKKHYPPADYAVLEQPDRLKYFCETTIESMRNGSKGAAYDGRLYFQEWDFSLDEIQIPLTLFHGEQDRTVPIAYVKRVVAKNLPTAQLSIYPEEGHISILNQFEIISKALIVK